MLKKIVLPLLLAAFFAQALYMAARTGQTVDETFYNGSGYPMVRYNDYRFLAIHPPLMMQLGSLPLLFIQPEFPINNPTYIAGGTTGIDISQTGSRFLYKMGNDPRLLLFLERIPNILIALLLGFFLFRWSSRLFGWEGGALSLFLFSLCPNVLAHASLFTTDLGVTAFFFISCYFLHLYFANGESRNLVSAGVFAGLAAVSKISGIVLFPSFALLFGIHWIAQKFRPGPEKGAGLGRAMTLFALIMMVFALGQKTTKAMLIPVALFALTPQAFIAKRGPVFFLFIPWLALWWFAFEAAYSLGGGHQFLKLAATGWGLAFLNLSLWMALNKLDAKMIGAIKAFCLVAFTAAVVIALDYTDYANGLFKLNPFRQYLQSFLIVLDHSKSHHEMCVPGSFITCDWKYFPAVFLVKTPLLALALFLAGAVLFLKSKRPFIEKAGVIVPPLAFFLVATFLSTVRIGIRHILPVYPFLYLMAGAVCPVLAKIKRPFLNRLGIAVLALYAISVFSRFPHYLSFYNETVPGYARAAELMADSNLNWGQDNRRLAEYVLKEKLPQIRIHSSKINEDEFNYYQISWVSVSEKDLHAPSAGYYALDRSLMKRLKVAAPWLAEARPVAKAGENYLIYKVEAGTATGAAEVRPGL